MDNNKPASNQPYFFLIHENQIPPGEIKERHLVVTTTIANGDLFYGDGNNNIIRLPIQANSALIIKNGIPTWVAGYTGTVTIPKLTTTNGSITFVNGVATAAVQPT